VATAPFGAKIGRKRGLEWSLVVGFLVAVAEENGWEYMGTGAVGDIGYCNDAKVNPSSIDVLAIAGLGRRMLLNKVHDESVVDSAEMGDEFLMDTYFDLMIADILSDFELVVFQHELMKESTSY
jgi:hypothetical protein